MSKHEFKIGQSLIYRKGRNESRAGDTSCWRCFRERVVKFATELEARMTRHLSTLLAKANLAPHSKWPNNPAGPPMTLGNMRELGVAAFDRVLPERCLSTYRRAQKRERADDLRNMRARVRARWA